MLVFHLMGCLLEIFPGQGSGKPISEIFENSLKKHEEFIKSGMEPRFIFGYSYGLYAALTAAGVLECETALELALMREKLVVLSEQTAPLKSFMLSVFGIDRQKGESLAKDYGLYVSNDNGPTLQVLSGYENRIERLEQEASFLNIRKTRRLPIEGAYHVPTKERIKDSDDYAQILEYYKFADSKIPLLSSTSPREMVSAQDIKAELALQMTRPLELVKAINLWQSLDVEDIIEAGSGDIKKMVDKIVQNSIVAA